MEKRPYVMVMVSDMKRSIRFYSEILGLKLRSESPEWTEFETGDATIALHGGGAKRETPPKPKALDSAGTCSLGFVVDDLDGVFRRLKSKGVRFTMPPTEREGEGIRLAVCLDPDGLPISLSQHEES